MKETANRGPRPTVPAGLVGMLALVIAVELGLSCGQLDLSSEHALSWSYTGRAVARKATKCEILGFGDSLIKFGMIPHVVRERLHRRAFNLALFNGPAPASYFLLRRALAAGARPRAIVVDFAGGILAEGPGSPVRNYPWSDLLAFGESLDLARAARDPDLFARVALGRLFPSVRRRFEIRAIVLEHARGGGSNRGEVNRNCIRNWKDNAGGFLVPARPGVRIEPPPDAPRLAGTWRCDPVNARYLDRFLDLASARGIAVYWVLPPFHPTHQAHQEYRGDDALYTAFVRSARDRHPGTVVVDGRHAGYAARAFYDEAHLNHSGAAAFSAGLADLLAASGLGGSPGERWVPMPEYRAQPDRYLEKDPGPTGIASGPPAQDRRR